jgi:peroxiredoxin
MDHGSEADSGEPAADRATGPGSRRRFVIVAAVCLVALLGVIGSQLVSRAKADAPQRGLQSQTGTGTGLTLYQPGDRVAAPDLRGETLSGAQLALADLRGRVVVLNVWGSWCNPCRAETPELVRVFRDTQARGVRFAGIDTRDNPDAARAFARSFHVPYPSLIDRDGRLLLAFKGLIPAYAVPSTIVIDPTGRIAARIIGRTDYATVRGVIDDLLTETAPGAPVPVRSGS